MVKMISSVKISNGFAMYKLWCFFMVLVKEKEGVLLGGEGFEISAVDIALSISFSTTMAFGNFKQTV